jgi:hypothetical protein
VGEVHTWVHDLERRWQEEELRERVYVSAASSAFGVSVPTSAPPQVAWEFLTVPGRRTGWQTGVTDVLLADSTGNRRSVGATIHCMHGAEAVVEEILDWRPYDYWSNRSTINTPAGPMRMLSTVELEPTASGTTIHFRYATPTAPKERAILKDLLPMYEGIFKESSAAMINQLEAELAVRRIDPPVEPELPARKPDSVVAALAPESA